MLRCGPLIDGPDGGRAATGRLLALHAPLTALYAIVAGSILMSPMIATTLLGVPQWIVVFLLLIGYAAVAVPALRSANPPRRSVDPWLACWAGCFAAAFTSMIIANAIHEHGLTVYIAAQTFGLVGVLAMVTFPLWAPRRATAGAEQEAAAARR